MGPNAKAWAVAISGTIMTLAAAVSKDWFGVEIGSDIATPATALIALALTYFVPNKAAS